MVNKPAIIKKLIWLEKSGSRDAERRSNFYRIFCLIRTITILLCTSFLFFGFSLRVSATTYTGYSSASDGFIQMLSFVSYADAHNSATGTASATEIWASLGQTNDPGDFILRGFFFFDTSTIPSNATITSATLGLYGQGDYSTTDFNLTVQNGQPTYPHDPVVAGDYLYSQYSGSGGTLSTTGFSTSGYNDITLNTDGISWIQKGDGAQTKLAVLSSRDISVTAPSGEERVTVYFSEQGEGYQPRLVVNYTTNTAPTLTSISDSPDPIKGGSQIIITPTGQGDGESDVLSFYCNATGSPSAIDYLCAGTGYTSTYGSMTCAYNVSTGDTTRTVYCRTYDGVDYSTPDVSTTYVVDTTGPTVVFSADVASGPVASDTITSSWGDASVKKWDYDTDGVCSTTSGDYSKTDADSMDQTTLTNNTIYICLYGEDAVGNKTTQVSANDINIDATAPTVTTVSSGKTNGAYTTGEVIDIDVTFSEVVTSTGNVTVTLETGDTDRTCTFTVSSSTAGTCDYTIQAGDTSSDLTVSSITGTVKDAVLNSLVVPATPIINLAANKALVIETTAPTTNGSGGGGLPTEAYNTPSAPVGGFKVAINQGASTTSSRIVNLSLIVGSDTRNMAISNFSDFNNATQGLFQPIIKWDLCWQRITCLNGQYTVYAKFYTRYGRASEVVYDDIIYTNSATNIDTSNVFEIPSAFVFTHDLYYGIKNKDVIYLKLILTKEGCLSGVTNTDYFATKTLAAVKCFQNKYKLKISTFAGYSINSTGFVGVGTRTQLNDLQYGTREK